MFGKNKHYRPNGPGSITGSIAEEDESSDDEPRRNLTVHENRPGTATPRAGSRAAGNGGGTQRSPLGLSSMRAGSYNNRQGSDSDSDAPAGRRRAASDIGVGGGAYKPPASRMKGLQRTFSHNAGQRQRPGSPNRRRRSSANSDSSSARGVPVKKKGFFASLGRLFRGSGNKRGRGSEAGSTIGASGGAWKTRTDRNLRSSGGGRGGDSSSEDEGGNLVSVSNNRDSTWAVENVGRAPSAAGNHKRNSNLPIASGLIPAPPNKRQSSQSTITGVNSVGGGGMKRSNTMRSTASTATARSANTVRSAGTATGTGKTRPNGSISRTARRDAPATDRNSMMALVNKSTPAQQNQPPTMPDVPKAPKSQVTPQMSLPTAPGSSIVRPGDISGLPRSTSAAGGNRPASAAGTATKPGLSRSTSVGGQSTGTSASKKRTSTNSAAPKVTGQNAIYGEDELYPHHSISRSNSVQRVPKAAAAGTAKQGDGESTPAPRPPSRLLAPPLKSALRPSSPTPQEPAPKIEMFSISAPGPVQVEREQHQGSFPSAVKPQGQAQGQGSPVKSTIAATAAQSHAKAAQGSGDRPRPGTRNSYHSMTTDAGESVYESAMEDEGEAGDAHGQGQGEAKMRQVTGADIRADPQDGDSSSDEETGGWSEDKYNVVDNERVKRLGINIDYDEPQQRTPRGKAGRLEDDDGAESDGTAEPSPVAKARSETLPQQQQEDSVSRRKSVRIKGPDSPNVASSAQNQSQNQGQGNTTAPTGQHAPPPTSPPSANVGDGSDDDVRAAGQGQGQQWDTRIGRMRDDSSDEEEEQGDDEYKRAKRGLMRNTGDFGKAVVQDGKDGKGKSKSGGSQKGSRSGGSQAGVRRSKSTRA